MEAANDLCKNCGHPLGGRFCSHCGQRADIHRVSWHEIAHHFPHALLHVDGGLFFTLRELALRPGHTCREYLLGKRKPHYNPFLLLIMSAGLCSLFYAYFKIPTLFAGIRLDKMETQSATLAHKFFAIRLAFIILLCSVGDSLIFKRAGYSFPEFVILNCFVFCGVSVMQLLFAPLLYAGQRFSLANVLHGALLLSALWYLWWARVQFFKIERGSPYRWWIAMVLVVYLLLVGLVGLKIVQPLLAWR
jgi:hypothetical protein